MTDLDICICTFRRPGVTRTLASVLRQDVPDGLRVGVLVVDNDDTPSARPMVEAARGALPVRYLHAPGRNISIARNAALDASDARYTVFLDDDEEAAAGWLRALWQRHEDTGAPVVLGPVDPVYPDGAPRWMKAAGIHATRPVRRRGVISTGYTCNVLMDRAEPSFRALRFDTALGRSGGEDSDYFATMATLGARIEYAPDARVAEPVTPERLSWRWLAQRRFRMGQTHAHILRTRLGTRPWSLVPLALGKALLCGALALVTVVDRRRSNTAVLRGLLHVGVVAGLSGRPVPVLYGAPTTGGLPETVSPNGGPQP